MAVIERVARYRWVILGVAFAGQLSYALATQAIAPLAPLIQPELGLSKMEVGFFSSAAFAGAWGVLVVGGTLTDRFGVRKMLIIGQLATGIFVLAMSTVGSFLHAAAMMFASGLGGGAILPTVSKAIMDWFPPSSRATAMGVKQAAVPFGGFFTAATLPLLALQIGWRYAIAVVGVFMLGGAIATRFLYQESRLQENHEERPTSMTASLKAVATNGNVWLMSLTAILFVNVQMGLTTYLALYLKEVVLVPLMPDERTRIVAAGGYLALCQAGGFFGRVFWGVVSDRIFKGRRLVVLALVGSIALAMSLIMAWLEPGSPLWLLTGVVFVYGITAIGWNPLFHVAITETVGRQRAGTGIGIGMTMGNFGSVLGPPLFGFVVDTTGTYQMAWLLEAGFCLAGTFIALVAARGEKRIV